MRKVLVSLPSTLECACQRMTEKDFDIIEVRLPGWVENIGDNDAVYLLPHKQLYNALLEDDIPKKNIHFLYPFYGEESCSAVYKSSSQVCKYGGYYLVNDDVLCGVHSKGKDRIELKKNPKKNENKTKKINEHKKGVSEAQEKNKREGKRGDVKCMKMYMMKEVPLIDGYELVFPNFRHGNRKDGLGLPSLSPMSISNIDHGQPGLPISKNLENFHQGNKVFSDEVDEKGNIKESFFETQMAFYLDDTPHRHKTNATGNVPLFSVWKSKDGKVHRLTYIQSRQLYCTYYERAAKQDKYFIDLLKRIEEGLNVIICGYDGFEPTKTLHEHYLDPSRPFGHEIVLYTLLTTDGNYPWVIEKTLDF